MTKKVCIVGAGASGLPSIRHARLYNFDVVCFEAQNNIGGLWRFKPEQTDEASVMKSTVINSSKELTAYSDFPPPATTANFMHNTHMFKYLEDYADEFDLRQYIKLKHKVLNVERVTDYSKTGKWTVTVEDLATGTISSDTYDGVLMCTGHHTLPYWPQPWKGQEKYKGEIIHAHSYKDFRGYEDKVVVVVGVGNSGGDIAVELSKIAKQVYLVSRRGTWVFNRVADYGRPVDCFLNARFYHGLRTNMPTTMSEKSMQVGLNKRFDHALYKLKPKHGVFCAHPTINDELPNRIAAGTVRVKPGIAEFRETSLLFDDGTEVKDVDSVIVSTGYSFEFPIIEKGEMIKVEENQVSFYQFIYPNNLEHTTLGVIGLVQPYGSIMPISEMQARVFLSALAGETKLPSHKERSNHTFETLEKMNERYAHSRRHTIQVDYLPYMDELAALIDCTPLPWHAHLPSDIPLALASAFTPTASYFYRLRGPHAWKGAREAILSIEDRIVKATDEKAEGSILNALKNVALHELLTLIIFFIVLLVAVLF